MCENGLGEPTSSIGQGFRETPRQPNSISQIDGDSDMTPASSMGRGLSKRAMASASTSVWEKAALPSLTLVPDNSVFSHMSLVPFKLLLQHWSSRE